MNRAAELCAKGNLTIRWDIGRKRWVLLAQQNYFRRLNSGQDVCGSLAVSFSPLLCRRCVILPALTHATSVLLIPSIKPGNTPLILLFKNTLKRKKGKQFPRVRSQRLYRVNRWNICSLLGFCLLFFFYDKPVWRKGDIVNIAQSVQYCKTPPIVTNRKAKIELILAKIYSITFYLNPIFY